MVKQEQIEEWKSQYHDIYMIGSDPHYGYVRFPDKKAMKMAYSSLKQDSGALVNSILANCWLGGDEAVKTDPFFKVVSEQILDVVSLEDAEVTPIDSTKSKVTILEFSAVLRIPDRALILEAERKNPSNKPFVSSEYILDKIWVEGDEIMKERPLLFFSLLATIDQLSAVKKEKVKKL